MSDPQNLIERAARIIHPEAFHPPWWKDGKPDAADVARKNHQQSLAKHRATMVLKMAARTPDLVRLLVEDEKDGWERLGIPIREHPELEKVIEEKFEVYHG